MLLDLLFFTALKFHVCLQQAELQVSQFAGHWLNLVLSTLSLSNPVVEQFGSVAFWHATCSVFGSEMSLCALF